MALILPRRKFLAGLVAAFAAPAIVKATSLMPISARALQPTVSTVTCGGLPAEIGDFLWMNETEYRITAVTTSWANGFSQAIEARSMSGQSILRFA